MKMISLIGAFLMTFALFSYGVGSISIHRFKEINKGVLGFLTLGIILDIAAIICMISGSKNTPFTWHGFIGYSAFTVMAIDVALIWKEYFKKGLNKKVNRKLYLYSRLAYIWWIMAYITGSLLIILKKVVV